MSCASCANKTMSNVAQLRPYDLARCKSSLHMHSSILVRHLVDWTGGLDQWTGLVDWTGGLDQLKIMFMLRKDKALFLHLHCIVKRCKDGWSFECLSSLLVVCVFFGTPSPHLLSFLMIFLSPIPTSFSHYSLTVSLRAAAESSPTMQPCSY